MIETQRRGALQARDFDRKMERQKNGDVEFGQAREIDRKMGAWGIGGLWQRGGFVLNLWNTNERELARMSTNLLVRWTK